MTLRDDLLPLVNAARTIVDDLGMHQTRVLLRTRVWSSGKIQTGTAAVSDLEIVPRPHVNGVAGDPQLEVGPISPPHVGGGYTPAQLNPGDGPGVEHVHIIIGPDGVQRPYKLMQLTTTRAMRYMLALTALDRKVPF